MFQNPILSQPTHPCLWQASHLHLVPSLFLRKLNEMFICSYLTALAKGFLNHTLVLHWRFSVKKINLLRSKISLKAMQFVHDIRFPRSFDKTLYISYTTGSFLYLCGWTRYKNIPESRWLHSRFPTTTFMLFFTFVLMSKITPKPCTLYTLLEMQPAGNPHKDNLQLGKPLSPRREECGHESWPLPNGKTRCLYFQMIWNDLPNVTGPEL